MRPGSRSPRTSATLFSGILLLETLLVLVLAPAFTTGAISSEREKQTLDLLVTTPLSTLGMVIGKLLSALSYVFILIIASVPLMALVFVFGSRGPGGPAAGVRGAVRAGIRHGRHRPVHLRARAADPDGDGDHVIVVLALTLGTAAVHEFWTVLGTTTSRPRPASPPSGHPTGARRRCCG